MGKEFSRGQRVAEQIRRELAELIRLEIKDPRVGFISLTDVEISPDFSHAKVYFSSMRGEEGLEEILLGLRRASGFLRRELGRRIRIHTLPELHFHYDKSVLEGSRLSALIDEAVRTDREHGSGSGIPSTDRFLAFMGRRKGLAIDGVLLLDKPRGLSSNAALQRARRALGAAKAGHTGTLDPMATGLLPLAFGEATKFSQYLLDADKVYLAEIRLGETTDTGDAEGQVISVSQVRPSAEAILATCNRFVGEMDQLPPMYSALKRDGKALYEYARAGVDVERQPRRIRVAAIDVLDIDGDRFRCRIRCSKGTYIRVLAEDIGQALGCGAHLIGLEREETGPFHLKGAVPLLEFEAMSQTERLERLLPTDSFVLHLPALLLSEAVAGRICHGQAATLPSCDVVSGAYRLYAGERFLGLGRSDGCGLVTPMRLLSMNAGGLEICPKL